MFIYGTKSEKKYFILLSILAILGYNILKKEELA